MIGLIKLNLLKLNLGKREPRAGLTGQRQTRTSLLGIALDGQRLEAVAVRRSNGSARVQGVMAASLQLNLLTDPPELVGREIRNHLDRAGLRERHCTVCLPLEWALTVHAQVPELPPEDVESFLNLEAERGFPFPLDTLAVAASRCRVAGGAQFATLIAIPKDHLARLRKVLSAARLKPVSFSLGLPALQESSRGGSEGVAALGVGDNGVELQVTSGNGIAALRRLQGALEQDGLRKKPYVDVVARDLRITLGQLPPELRQTVQRLKVFGNGADLSRFVDELGARAKLMGLEIELVQGYAGDNFGFQPPANASVSPALSLALRFLSGRPELEFLPPKASVWKQMTGRYSSRKLVWAGAASGAVMLMLAGVLLFQQWQLTRWQSKWMSIRPRVTQLDEMQQQIRQYRPWFDESFRTLSILQKVTEAFPEDGSVTAKTVEIREPGVVTCSGTTRDQQALLKAVDQLRATREFSSVQLDQIRGKQFSMNLRWSEGGSGQ